MRRFPRFFRAFSAFAVPLLIAITASSAGAATVVISEFAHRGPTNATEEFVELHNTTDSAIDIGGWKLQYKQAAGGAFSDRAIFPANTIIPARGYFLIANNAYTSIPVPADYTSGLWGSGQGMADNGHERIIDASAVEIDKVGWGSTADSPEGTFAPNHGTSANNNSVERKALATSTADSMRSGGAHALLGNNRDTNNNSADYLVQTFGRKPQNTASGPEPGFSGGGNGTGRARVAPTVVFTGRAVDTLRFSFNQDSAYTLTKVAIHIPASWTWAHSPSSIVLTGSGFASATPTVVGDSIFVEPAALSPTDSGQVAITSLTSPATTGSSSFTVRTAVAAGTLAQIAQQPSTRVLELVPIVVVHVNDASGVPTAPYQIGAEATVTGTITANYSTTQTNVFLQDGTAGINIFNFTPIAPPLDPGDSVTVTGSILQFRGLTELQLDFAQVQRHATGRPIPEPMVMTCANVNATFKPDFTEPNEGRLIRINGVTYNSAASTITDASGTTNIFIPNTYPPPPAQFDIIGNLKQFKPGTPAPGPPYTTDYEITPRTPDDIIAHAGPVLITTPYEDNIQSTSVQFHWTTDVASSSIVAYGTTSALTDTARDATPVTSHTLTVSGLSPATVYHYSAGSSDVNGTNYSPASVFSTASPPATTGEINVYFNKSVDPSLAWIHTANANQDLTARLVTRFNNAQRSIDAVFYNLSGTPGASLASALVAAKNRGVKVRVICEDDNRSNSPYNTIAAASIPLITDRFDSINNGLGLMHNKFASIDSRGGAPESCWVWTGSWNPTDPGTNDDLQNSIELQDQALARIYTLEFEEMWGSGTETPNAANSRFGARKLDDSPHHFVVGGRPIDCYFSPSDGVTSRIISLVNSAQHTIAFQLLTMTRSDISAAIVAQHNAGKKVRGNLDSSSDTGSQYSFLVSNSIDVHLKTGVSGLLHHKYALIDAEYPYETPITLTGSHNWSSAAENNNSENTLVVHDADITNQYLQEFGFRYTQFGGTDPIRLDVEPIDGVTPRIASLGQNYPNPFERTTHIVYALPTATRVKLKLYDVLGREVRTLVDQRQVAGNYRVEMSSTGLPSGVYLYRLDVAGAIQQRKMLLLH